MQSLKSRLERGPAVLAPLVLNPLMAKLAAAAGFPALYLGGGASGYANCFLEANLTLTEMCEQALQIRAVTSLPLILDAAGGWGDPMHMHRTVATAEAAGFAAIEIEDQYLPKRAHHHIGLEHMIEKELMAAKVREAVAVRRSPEFLIIARSNAVRASDMDDALTRAEAYKKAGADILLLSPRNADEARLIAERLPPPLMFLGAGGLRRLGLSVDEMAALGYRLLVDAQTPLLAAYKAWKACYAALAGGLDDPSIEPQAIQDEIHETIGLDRLLQVERQTVESGR